MLASAQHTTNAMKRTSVLSTLLLLECSIQLREGQPGPCCLSLPPTHTTFAQLHHCQCWAGPMEDGTAALAVWLHPQKAWSAQLGGTLVWHSPPSPALPFLAELHWHTCPHATCECSAFGLLHGLNKNAELSMKIKCLSMDCSILQILFMQSQIICVLLSNVIRTEQSHTSVLHSPGIKAPWLGHTYITRKKQTISHSLPKLHAGSRSTPYGQGSLCEQVPCSLRWRRG